MGAGDRNTSQELEELFSCSNLFLTDTFKNVIGYCLDSAEVGVKFPDIYSCFMIATWVTMTWFISHICMDKQQQVNMLGPLTYVYWAEQPRDALELFITTKCVIMVC